jgi:hypothetical protein
MQRRDPKSYHARWLDSGPEVRSCYKRDNGSYRVYGRGDDIFSEKQPQAQYAQIVEYG